MWLCLSDAFISVVEDRDDPTCVLVRSRNSQHLKNLLPEAKIEHTPERDYAYRVHLEKTELAAVISKRVTQISYPNFKESVEEKPLRDFFGKVWLLGLKYEDSINAA